MTRLVSTQPGNNPTQEYLERVAKYVPVEIVGAYLAIQSIFQSASPATPAAPAALAAPTALTAHPGVEFVFYGLLVIATVLYLLQCGGDVPGKGRQVVIGTISFVVWTYGMKGSFFWDALGCALDKTIMDPRIAGGVVVMWSVVSGLVKPIQGIRNVPQPAATT